MSRIAYVNGQYVPHGSALVHIEDRGYQFADGVYEVVAIWDGRLIDETPHLARLERSLNEIDMALPVTPSALKVIIREVSRRNRVKTGLVYIQVTRGVAPRDHGFPDRSTRPALVVTAKPFDGRAIEARASKGVAIITRHDDRWDRCDIKSIGLLANVLAKQEAREAGAYEAWFVDEEGMVTEGSSSTAWIVTAAGEIVTRHLDQGILPGITRATLINVAAERGLSLVERPFSVAQAKDAKEAFMTSASAYVLPVVTIDGSAVADGRPGPVTLKLREAYFEAVGDTSLRN